VDGTKMCPSGHTNCQLECFAPAAAELAAAAAAEGEGEGHGEERFCVGIGMSVAARRLSFRAGLGPVQRRPDLKRARLNRAAAVLQVDADGGLQLVGRPRCGRVRRGKGRVNNPYGDAITVQGDSTALVLATDTLCVNLLFPSWTLDSAARFAFGCLQPSAREPLSCRPLSLFMQVERP
jgi:hypothetical protein